MQRILAFSIPVHINRFAFYHEQIFLYLMNSQTLLLIIIGITVFDFLLNKTLGILNNQSRKKPIPAELSGIYSKEKYLLSQEYQTAVFRSSLVSSTLSFMVMTGLLWFQFYGWLDHQISQLITSDALATLCFFGVLYLTSDVIGIPFQLYNNFVIEEKYGFNKMTLKTFIIDKIKGWFLTLLIGGILLSVFVYLISLFGTQFWWYFWLIISLFMIGANMFYTSLIVPLFNRLSPLENGALKEAIETYSAKVGFPLNNIFVIDGSKRSSKGNAFFSGLGKKKKVVLYDTLIENHTEDELVGILAHEVGHFKKKHIIYAMILSIGQIGIMLWLLSQIILNPVVSAAMGGSSVSIQLNILAFGIIFSPVSTIISILMNIFSRKNEYEADAYAVNTFRKEPLIHALKKLTTDNLGNLTPHPWYVFVNYSHPSLLQRIRAMEAIK